MKPTLVGTAVLAALISVAGCEGYSPVPFDDDGTNTLGPIGGAGEHDEFPGGDDPSALPQNGDNPLGLPQNGIVPVMPCETPPSSIQPPYSCDTGLLCAQSYNILVFTDYVGGVDVGGKIAAGANLSMSSFSVGHQDQGGDAIVVGGDVTLSNGFVHGNVVHNGAASISQNVGFNGDVVPGLGLNFFSCVAQICGASNGLHHVAPNGIVEFEDGNDPAVHLIGTHPCVNVFQMDAGVLSAAKHLTIKAPPTATIVINIDGDSLTLTNFGISFLAGADFQKLVINAPETSTIDIHGFGVEGTLLACNADVYFDNGQQRGTLVARSLSGNGEFHSWPFHGCLPEEKPPSSAPPMDPEKPPSAP